MTHFIHRRQGLEPVTYDHALERPALERTLGVILYQDQVGELCVNVAGMTAREGDVLRRAFGKRNNAALLEHYWEVFRDGAASRGVPEETAQRIFAKFNAGYQFPESHAYAFAVTSYQMAWLKCYHPLEFYVGLVNAQPMGFWGLDTVKQDAARHGIPFLAPHVNLSVERAVIEGKGIRLGLLAVKNIGAETARVILEERLGGGLYKSLAEFMRRTKLRQEEMDSLTRAGALDCFGEERRQVLWETGLRYQPLGKQMPLTLPTQQDMVELPRQTRWERMAAEYRMMGLSAEGHLFEELRRELGPRFVTSGHLESLKEGATVLVGGMVVRLQHPAAAAYFVTLED
ncbi:MAG: error-prone DNA polymerase, partial [Chloroflexota bacterium]|nr:error-prone DNA polymerase [Chloroflexota bacterium]